MKCRLSGVEAESYPHIITTPKSSSNGPENCVTCMCEATADSAFAGLGHNLAPFSGPNSLEKKTGTQT